MQSNQNKIGGSNINSMFGDLENAFSEWQFKSWGILWIFAWRWCNKMALFILDYKNPIEFYIRYFNI